MKQFLTVSSTVVLAALLALSSALGQEGDQNKKMKFDVTEATQVPGATLQPGSYVLRVEDYLSDRHILQVTDASGSRVIATFLATPNSRLTRPAAGAPFTYWTAPAGQGKPVRAWFIPASLAGTEFVYEKGKAVEIAKVVSEPVPAIDPESQLNLTASNLSQKDLRILQLWLLAAGAIEPQTGQASITAAKLDSTERKAAVTPAAAVSREEPRQLASSQVASNEVSARARSLPKTASPLPLIGLIGLLSAGAGLGLRSWRLR